MKIQTTDKILMVSPDYFGFNDEAFETNTFMHKINDNNVTPKALIEFEIMVKKLKDMYIHVHVLKSNPNTPDAVFPNNWFASHYENGKKILAIFPMLNKSRQREVQLENLSKIINPDELIDLRKYEKENRALEGTGSIVFDRVCRKAYACISPRTDRKILIEYLNQINYKPVIFESYSSGKLVYHTNVVMGIGENFAVICSETIKDEAQKEMVLSELKKDKESVIEISEGQMNDFCGNILQLRNTKNESIICMSETSFKSFSDEQIEVLKKYGEIQSFDIKTIETIGGGSVRCMIGELFIN